MRKIEQNSSGWKKARKSYENSDSSIRDLAAELKVDEKTVRNRIKAENWARKSANFPQNPQGITLGEAAAAVVAKLEVAVQAAAEANIPVPAEMARNTCITIDALRVLLQGTVQNFDLIRELAEADAGNDAARRRLVDKVLSIPTLIKAGVDLTAAIARLADNSPGKKELAQEAAKDINKGRFATPAPPKFPSDNLH